MKHTTMRKRFPMQQKNDLNPMTMSHKLFQWKYKHVHASFICPHCKDLVSLQLVCRKLQM